MGGVGDDDGAAAGLELRSVIGNLDLLAKCEGAAQPVHGFSDVVIDEDRDHAVRGCGAVALRHRADSRSRLELAHWRQPPGAADARVATSAHARPAAAADTVASVEFSRELRNDVLAGDVTLSIRLWKRPKVKPGGHYRVGPGEIQVDAVELVPFAAITAADVPRTGEVDRETLRQRAAHAGPIDEDTLVYRVEFHPLERRS